LTVAPFGDDNDCIVALTPGRLGKVAAGFEVVEDLRMVLDGPGQSMPRFVEVNALEDLRVLR